MMEIMVPASGREEGLSYLKAGATALYLGISGFCRWEAQGVSPESFKAILSAAKRDFPAAKIYAALNRIPAFGQQGDFFRALGELAEQGAAGVILNDGGLMGEPRRRYPSLKILSSIGISPLNQEEAGWLQDLGANRILLPENTGAAELKILKNRFPALELEMFYRGKRDFTYTGKCFISGYAFQEFIEGQPRRGSAKRGGCGENCRSAWRLEGETVSLAPVDFVLKQRLTELTPYLSALKLGAGKFEETLTTVGELQTFFKDGPQ